MTLYKGQQIINQLEKRKGGYFYLRVGAEIVAQFPRKRATRMICTLDNTMSYRCGLNHLGDGNYFIIVASKYLEKLGKGLGDLIDYKIEEDPDPLGVAIPEVVTVFLDQEAEYNTIFNTLTDGKKRSLIYSIHKIRDIDRQVKIIMAFLDKEQRRTK
ncbi:MAG: DUF1905 domain-containing protein [Bacteroidota bacterium]